MKTTTTSTLIAFLALLALALPGWGATTGSVTISGTVSPILEITVSPTGNGTNLDLAADFTTTIANVTERSNKKAGYTVTLSSANLGTASGNPMFKSSLPLANPDYTTDTLSYSLSYGGSAVTFGAGGLALVSDVTGKTSAAGSTKALELSYSGAAQFLDASSYSDTLTFTIAAK